MMNWGACLEIALLAEKKPDALTARLLTWTVVMVVINVVGGPRAAVRVKNMVAIRPSATTTLLLKQNVTMLNR